MKILLIAALAAAATAHAAHPQMPVWGAAEITRECDATIAKARATVTQMESRKGGDIYGEWNRLQIAIEDVAGPVSLLSAVHPDKAARDAAEPCQANLTTLSTDIFQNEKLFARVKAAKPKGAHQVKFHKDLMEGFEDSGVALPPKERARSKEIFEKLELLRQAFDRNIRDDPTKVTFTAAELEGMPEAYVKARKPDDKGNYVLGLDNPTYQPFMANAKNGAARERYYRAKTNQGGAQNLKLLEEMFTLRQELAGLYGLPNFAAYSVRRKMVERPEVVNKFLADVKAAVADLEKKDVEELRADKAKEQGTPLAETKMNRWDSAYHQERVRKARFAIDQEEMRKYFPTDKAIDFVLLVSQTLYGVTFKPAKVATWHPDVRYYDVFDAKTAAFVSGFYLDLYPREGKYNHAAAWPVRGVSKLAGRTPYSALVVNFNKQGLTHDEMVVLMHEFGHVLHGVLSKTDYNPQSGTATVQDFVEAPSQMFEEWVRREAPLGLMKKVCPECPALSPEQIKRLDESRKFGAGMRYARQWTYAAYDMTLSQKPQPPLDAWKAIEAVSPLGHVEGTMFPAGFSHIASNYAAGYYGYMWSEVLALDMLSQFEKNMLDPKVGARYRDTILSQGGQVDAMAMVKRFLGREPSSDAFFKEITGRR
ncbi:M3 family metallopeptidase [Usitatibacter palustris]|uniref:Oligopeptidase A n=1 Tax=Usitatibacter palustris TaxID=2732487 RepID=A0A6M4H7U5_9PROT|nr:M3 family metallopeptidase [Usitatibacter palustris]QJR15640.1 Oligopeptidase A [Usitatibacter palustris]